MSSSDQYSDVEPASIEADIRRPDADSEEVDTMVGGHGGVGTFADFVRANSGG